MTIKKHFFIITLTVNFVQFAYDAENKCYAALPLQECLKQLLAIKVTDQDVQALLANAPQSLKQLRISGMADLDRASSPQNLEKFYHLDTDLRTAHHTYSMDACAIAETIKNAHSAMRNVMEDAVDGSYSPHISQCAKGIIKEQFLTLDTAVASAKYNAKCVLDSSLGKTSTTYKALNIQVPQVSFYQVKEIIRQAVLRSHALWALVDERLEHVKAYVDIINPPSDLRSLLSTSEYSGLRSLLSTSECNSE